MPSKQPTDFANTIYKILATQVPVGKVTTYKALAQASGTRAYRAIGQIMKNNPHSWHSDKTVPCHRVIASDGTLGGFAYGTQAKKDLLLHEGIQFKGNKISEEQILRTLSTK
jgi:methylated-DNA-[protein]-cysteine S-methyltransferase